MTYDHWKTTNPADEFLGPEPDEAMQPMGKCIVCGAPIFTSNEPVEGQPCLDCIFDGKA